MNMCAAFSGFGDTVVTVRGPRRYCDTLTAEVNRKGVLDIDTVKGCSSGLAAHPNGGCYGACYACAIARFRGIDFSQAVVRRVHGSGHADRIERTVRSAPYGFFRVGMMGDPSHAWPHTVSVVEWLAPLAVPVIVTKHWRTADDGDVCRLVECGAVLNTSISALDTLAELSHRKRQISRYAAFGGVSVARIVSCQFNPAVPEGARLAAIQAGLFSEQPNVIDNPLRIPRTHELVRSGVVLVRRVRDLATVRSMSLDRQGTYTGHCNGCPDRCGLSWCGISHPKPRSPQITLSDEWSL